MISMKEIAAEAGVSRTTVSFVLNGRYERDLKISTEVVEKVKRTAEKLGYVRLREIPYKPADYDLLKTDTYPTRRWRGGELTPRW